VYYKIGDEKGERDLPRRRERLSSEREIKETLKSRQHVSKGPLLSLVARENSRSITRVAVITPKSMGKATKRNRLRRIFIEAFSKIRHKISKNVDLVVFPGRDAINAPFKIVINNLEDGLGKCQILENVENY